jgi:hypothetical protein
MTAEPSWGDRLNFEYHDAEHGPTHRTSILTWRDHAWMNLRLKPDAGGDWWRPAYFHNGIVRFLAPPMRNGGKCHRINLEDKKLVQARVLAQELGLGPA